MSTDLTDLAFPVAFLFDAFFLLVVFFPEEGLMIGASPREFGGEGVRSWSGAMEEDGRIGADGPWTDIDLL